jgi:hypothetical protein
VQIFSCLVKKPSSGKTAILGVPSPLYRTARLVECIIIHQNEKKRGEKKCFSLSKARGTASRTFLTVEGAAAPRWRGRRRHGGGGGGTAIALLFARPDSCASKKTALLTHETHAGLMRLQKASLIIETQREPQPKNFEINRHKKIKK